MKNRRHIHGKLLTLMLFFCCPLFLTARQNEDQEALKSLTVKLFKQFKESSENIGVHLENIIFTSRSQTHTGNGNADINFNADEIGAYIRGESPLFQKLFIQFVLAHEIAHKIQFNGYPKNVIESTRGEGSVFLECNADILANFLVTGVVNTMELPKMLKNPDFDLEAYNLSVQNAALKVYKRIFQMDQGSLVRTHPSHLQRLMAIKSGTLLGNCYNMQFVLPPTDGPALKAYQRNKKLLKIIGKAIDFNPESTTNNNPLLWAHSEAVRITNENNSLATNLIQYGVSVTRERTPGTSDRFFNYSFGVVNENSVPVRFSGRIYTETNSENDPDNLMKSIPIDAVPFEEIIPANGNVELKGRVQYVLQDGVSSDLILPGDKKSLYFVFDSRKPEIDMSDQSNANNDFTQWSSGMEEKIYDHISEVLSFRTELGSRKKGIGISKAENYDDAVSQRILFEPAFKAGQHDDQILFYIPSTKSMIYQFLATETPDAETASQRYKLIVDKIKNGINPEFVFHPMEDVGESKRSEFLDGTNKRVLLVRLITQGAEQKHIIEVNIYGK